MIEAFDTSQSADLNEEETPDEATTKLLLKSCFVIVPFVIFTALVLWLFGFGLRAFDVSNGEVVGNGRVFVSTSPSHTFWRLGGFEDVIMDDQPRIFASEFDLISGGRGKWLLRSVFNAKHVLVDVDTQVITTARRSSRTVPLIINSIRSMTVKHDANPSKSLYWEATLDSEQSVIADPNREKSETIIYLSPVLKVRGVSFGSWFIPERWMSPSVYQNVDPFWSQLCGLTTYLGVNEAERRMTEHLISWVDEHDFDLLRANGINSIRLPIGYWNVVEDPYHQFAPRDISTSKWVIEWAFRQAESRGMTVMIDMHGMPGSQNGESDVPKVSWITSSRKSRLVFGCVWWQVGITADAGTTARRVSSGPLSSIDNYLSQQWRRSCSSSGTGATSLALP